MTDSTPQAAARRRCTATSKRTGDQCGATPPPGALVCKWHGGGAPQTKQKAALRLASLVDPAIGTLAREMVKAEKSSDRQRAANSILDRAGITRNQSAELDVARALLLERLLDARGGAQSVGASPAPDPLEIVAEVVDDAPPKAKRVPRKPRPKKDPS